MMSPARHDQAWLVQRERELGLGSIGKDGGQYAGESVVEACDLIKRLVVFGSFGSPEMASDLYRIRH
jgi:hypothetical protein